MSKAVVSFGSHQYAVIPGARLQVLRLERGVGDEFDWDKVLLVMNGETATVAGKPYVQGAKVRFRVLRHLRDDKIVVFKKRSKKAWRKRRGHRTDLTELEVMGIDCGQK